MKEADALVSAGYDVDVVGAYWADWATAADERLLQTRAWRFTFVDWRPEHAAWLHAKSRVRHWAARKLRWTAPWQVAAAALSRVGPEVGRAAVDTPARLYIAHNLGALPGACAAAARHGARVAFDAEDFHSGQLSRQEDAGMASLTRTIECSFIPGCAYVSAASPGIAECYRDLCAIPLPTCILNVFPLRDRPATLRPADAGPLRLYWFSQTIGPHRGLEDAVRAIGRLAPHEIELHLRGTWQAGYEARLRAVANEAGVAQTRIIAHPPGDADEMVRLAAACDVGLASESPITVNNDVLLSNKIFTYLLAGNAIAASRTTGQTRLLHELWGAAVWYDPGDPDSLATALMPWIGDRRALDGARRTAWCLGETRFNWDREQRLFLDLVARALPAS